MALDLADLPTRRLLVRRLTMADLGSCHRLYLDVGWADAALSESETLDRRRASLDWTVRSYDQLLALTQPPYGERAVVRRDSGEFIGLVGLVPLLAPFGQLPAFGGIANARYEPAVGMFWCMLPDQQRRGYATDAAPDPGDPPPATVSRASGARQAARRESPGRAVLLAIASC